MLDSYPDVWSHEKSDITPVKGDYSLSIDMSDETPIRSSPYRLSQAQTEFLKLWCAQMVKAGVIQRAPHARWASPTLLPENKIDETGKMNYRVVHDFRTINQRCMQYAYQVPDLSEILNEVSGHPWITILDIRSAYNILPVKLEHQERTAFWGGDGLYQYKTAPLGLKNAGIIWQSVIDNILQGIPNVRVYTDDICVYGGLTLNEHLKMVSQVLQR